MRHGWGLRPHGASVSGRSVWRIALGIALAVPGAAGLASCGFVRVDILSSGNPIKLQLPERPPPPPLTYERIRGTACETGDWPAPDCLRYRSRPLDALCRSPNARHFPDDCAALRTDLPLPPDPRQRRPLLPRG